MGNKRECPIGDVNILSFDMETGWNKKDLYNSLIQSTTQDGIVMNYLYYYLKIYGDYDHQIVPEDLSCHACPNNPHFNKFHNYNELKDEKQQVLVLRSDTYDFREYEIYAAYYTDKESTDSTGTHIELWGDKGGFFSSILKDFGYRP